MQGDSTEIKRRQYLLAVLIVLAVIVSGLIFIIASYPFFLAPEPTITATITTTRSATLTATTTPTITPTATNTKTPRPTSSPTATLTPSITASPAPSATPIGLPTLTPALPFGNNLVYNLDGWTPEKADYLIKLMEGFPDALPEGEKGEDKADYYNSFEYAVIALSDALDQFPGSYYSEEWKWDYAFNLARVGDSSAGEAYAKVISEGLNNRDTTVEDLKSWFISKEPRLDLSLAQIDPVPGYVNSYLAEIRGGGGAYIWLLESEDGFQANVLETGFDFVNQPSMDWIFNDLNNNPRDGKEIAIFSSNKPDDYTIQPPEVFNLSQALPSRLLFIPDKDLFDVGMDFNNYWSVLKTETNQDLLNFESKVYPVCPVTINRTFLWNGTYFDYINEGYKVEPLPGALFFCEYILDHAENEWGPEAAIQIMEKLIPIWPPQVDENKNPYPPDALDELRYRLGVNHALAGNSKEAKDYLTLIVNTPTIPDSQWVQPAREFLEFYKLPEDVYTACLGARDCNPSYALKYLIKNLNPINLEDAVQILSDLGVNITSSSYFDFDGEKQDERWITVKHRPAAQLEYWILANSLKGGKAIFVGTVDTNPPITELLDEGFISEEAGSFEYVNFVDKKHAFVMKRVPDSLEPYIEFVPLRAEYPSHFQNGLDNAEEALFEMNDPQKARIELLNLQDWPGLHCEVTWSCDRYYYMLGLANELSGFDRDAVDVYLNLWRLYPESPFTTMGRLKLAGPGMQPTSIPVYTETSVPTASVTALPTGTVTPTIISTPTHSVTLTETPTITNTVDSGG
jgi:hypothetical protein